MLSHSTVTFISTYFSGPFNPSGPVNPGMNPGMGPMPTGPMVPGAINQMNPGLQQQQMGQVRPMGPGGMMGQRMGNPMGMNPHQNFMGQQ